ncbi:MAG: cell-cell cohesion protein MtsF [Deltaproteobacteria bacterium]|nr:cell-cell cohesion protein MtsF [Deltaproteobacteria bacterium]
MSPRSIIPAVFTAALVGLCWGCGPAATEEEEDIPEFVPPPDVCNTKEEALTNPACELKLGQVQRELIGSLGDLDWYVVQLPAGLTDRSLLHVNAAYTTPATAVNLSINVLRTDGTSIMSAKDVHGQAAPKPLDMILPFKESSTKLLVLVSDVAAGGRQHFDARSPYTLLVEVVQNPDANEPNDTTPTSIPLAAEGVALKGSQTGYVATANDVDLFSFDVPAGRKVTHLQITAPKLFPPPAYRLAYTLKDPSGGPVSEGWLLTEFNGVDLATARITNGGKYTLQIQGYHGGANDTVETVPGDLRQQYKVDVLVLPEADSYEPNDTMQTARAVPLSAPGNTANITARIGHVPDPDWYGIDLAPTTRPTVLYYKVSPTSNGGRFTTLPGKIDRMVRVFTPVTQGATEAERQNACRTNRSVCPRKDNDDDETRATVDAYCGLSPPRCMIASREETPKFTGLRNFEGAVPVPAHASTMRLYLLVQDDGSNWADDLDYQLKVEWRADPDEESRAQTVVRTLAGDTGGTFPVPPSGAAFELTGNLSYGHGYTRNLDPTDAQGVRGPNDYDVFTTDTDRYELRLPTGLSGDRTWELQWEVDHAGAGGPPYDVVLEIEFCVGTGCTVVARSIGYKGGNLGAWHSAGVQGAAFQPVYSRSTLSDRTQVTALAWGCFCLESRFVQSGKFFLTVTAVDRTSYANAQYRVRTAYTDYPKPYNGGMCPVPCNFTR